LDANGAPLLKHDPSQGSENQEKLPMEPSLLEDLNRKIDELNRKVDQLATYLETSPAVRTLYVGDGLGLVRLAGGQGIFVDVREPDIARSLMLSAELPHRNPSNKNIEVEITDTVRSEIQELYALDVALHKLAMEVLSFLGIDTVEAPK
jgi:hypothetical protein